MDRVSRAHATSQTLLRISGVLCSDRASNLMHFERATIFRRDGWTDRNHNSGLYFSSVLASVRRRSFPRLLLGFFTINSPRFTKRMFFASSTLLPIPSPQFLHAISFPTPCPRFHRANLLHHFRVLSFFRPRLSTTGIQCAVRCSKHPQKTAFGVIFRRQWQRSKSTASAREAF